MDQYEVRWSRTERSSVPRGFRKELGSGEYISILAECPGYKGQHRLFHFDSPQFECMNLFWVYVQKKELVLMESFIGLEIWFKFQV